MKKTVRGFSFFMAAIFVTTAFAACGKSKKEPETTTDTVTEVQAVVEEAVSETQPEGTTDKTAAEKTTKSASGASAKIPANSDELIAAYNKAIGARELVCSSVQQKIAEGTLGTADKVVVNLIDDGEADFKNKFERSDTNGMALAAISESDVKNVSINGNTATINLNDCSISDSVYNGSKGYANIVDTPRVKELVEMVESGVNVSGVKIKSTSLSMSNGQITVGFNNDFTSITYIKITYNQAIYVKMGWTVLTIIADLKYNISSEYK